MSSRERRAEKRAAWERECAARDAEYQRVRSLCIYARMQESNIDEDLREILTLIAEKAGVDIYEGEMS